MTGLWNIILPVFDLWIKLLLILMTLGVIAWLGTVFIRWALFLVYKIKETYFKLFHKKSIEEDWA